MKLLILLACKTTPAPAESTTTGPAPAEPPAAADVVPVSQETITLDPDEITYDEAAGTLVFSPGSRVRSASYTNYTLDLASLESVLGERPTAPVSVLVEVTAVEERTHTPEDPRAQVPDGGFKITEKTGRVIGRAP